MSDSLTRADLRAELRHQCEMAGGQAEWARRKNVSASQVCEALSGRRGMPVDIISALGLIEVTRYERIKRGSNHG
ncbi:MAG: hypothetical protein IT554_01050 [Sphingomonadaceae bacterium]|nr:hypothetical protein [Sphingomonadaceae bacterium]